MAQEIAKLEGVMLKAGNMLQVPDSSEPQARQVSGRFLPT